LVGRVSKYQSGEVEWSGKYRAVAMNEAGMLYEGSSEHDASKKMVGASVGHADSPAPRDEKAISGPCSPAAVIMHRIWMWHRVPVDPGAAARSMKTRQDATR